jgi:hypothetical protein
MIFKKNKTNQKSNSEAVEKLIFDMNKKINESCQKQIQRIKDSVGKKIIYLGKTTIVKNMVVDCRFFKYPDVVLAWMDDYGQECTTTVSYELFEMLIKN